MTARAWCRIVPVVITVVASCIHSEIGLAAGPATLDEILAGWRRRQETCRTVHIEWHERFTCMAGSQVGIGLRGANPDGARFPAVDTTLDQKNVLNLDGPRLHVTRSGKQWFEPAEEFLDMDWTVVTDGQHFWQYFGVPRKENDVHKIGSAGSEPGTAHTRLQLPRYLPLSFAFRPGREETGIGVDSKWNVRAATETIRDRPCTVLEFIDTSGSTLVQQIWVDAERDFAVPRFVSGIHALPIIQVDVGYRLDAKGTWVPIDWTVVLSHNEKPQVVESTVATVTTCTVGEPVDASAFTFEFPDGTLVNDYSGGAKTIYIARPHSAKRLITAAEQQRGAKYRDLVGSEEGRALEQGSGGTGWLAWSAVGAVIGTIVWYGWHRARRA